jgi:hypothetical protein
MGKLISLRGRTDTLSDRPLNPITYLSRGGRRPRPQPAPLLAACRGCRLQLVLFCDPLLHRDLTFCGSLVPARENILPFPAGARGGSRLVSPLNHLSCCLGGLCSRLTELLASFLNFYVCLACPCFSYWADLECCPSLSRFCFFLLRNPFCSW